MCYFDDHAQTYASTRCLRLALSCAKSIVEHIHTRVPLDTASLVADIGCGDAYLASLLLDDSESVECILVDVSDAMLEKARERLKKCGVLDRASLVRADAGAVPLRSDSTTAVLMSFVLHTLPDFALALDEVARILVPGGHFFLLTYDPDDLVDQIYHRYFPGYREIDLQRFAPIPQLVPLLRGCGFVDINISEYSYEVRFSNVDEAVDMVEKKPCSGFANYSDRDFAEKLKKFEFELQRHFGEGEVVHKYKVILLSMVKSQI